ncbi:MAG: Nudix family hydrolase [Candidatus Polarisedimenticolaceae bacterium]|nr:Nudix family hydrolase [Candidatus Polarisedimenticolaceae bacterium]
MAKRPEHVHKGGLWEFPGGKLEAGESVQQGLARELDEELGIHPTATEPLICITHHYPEYAVKLDIYRVTAFAGEAHGREGQPIRWLHPEEMQLDQFPEADRPVISALRLPDHYLITGANPEQPEQFLQRLEQALQGGMRLVQLRAHTLDETAYQQLAAAALLCCRRYGARLLLNRADEAQFELAADGLHLPSHRLMQLQQRPIATEKLLGASCHNLAELQQAEKVGVDYVLLSPVLPTDSHPGAPSLGWDCFADWVAQVNLPVFALGGMRARDLPQVKQLGGQGIAAISEFWPK